MKKSLLVFVLLLLTVEAFCKSKKKAEEKTEKPASPVWMTDEGRLSVFPSAQYLSAFAFGGTPDSAKVKAGESLSEYVKSHVTSSVNYSMSNDDYSVSQDSTVTTDNLMFCTEYTSTFYSEYHGMYCVVAFIDRNKAFNYVKTKLDGAAKVFPVDYEQALLLEDDFDKIIAIRRAQKSLKDFYEVYDFARAINPEKSAYYESINNLSIQSQSTLNQLRNNVTINISVENDSNGRFKAAVSDLLSRTGFLVSENSANYLCTLKVNLESSNKTESTFEIHPSYSLTIVHSDNPDDVKLSVVHNLNKASGFDKSTAERRANLFIENDIKNKLVEEF